MTMQLRVKPRQIIDGYDFGVANPKCSRQPRKGDSVPEATVELGGFPLRLRDISIQRLAAERLQEER